MRGRHVVAQAQERPVQRERRVLIDGDGENVRLARAVDERVVEAARRGVDADLRASGRSHRRVQMELGIHELICTAVRGAYRGPAVSLRVLREADARTDIPPLR